MNTPSDSVWPVAQLWKNARVTFIPSLDVTVCNLFPHCVLHLLYDVLRQASLLSEIGLMQEFLCLVRGHCL